MGSPGAYCPTGGAGPPTSYSDGPAPPFLL